MEHAQHGHGRHEHAGRSSRGTFRDREVLLEAGLGPGDDLIDAGCGDGHFSVAASEIVGSRGSVHSFDKHNPSLELLKSEISEKGIGNIVVAEVDLSSEIPLGSGTVDMILFSNVLHGFVHNGEMNSVLKWIDRVLRSDGKVAVIEFRKEPTPSGPPLDHRVSRDELMVIFSELDLDLIHTNDLTENHDLLIFSKDA